MNYLSVVFRVGPWRFVRHCCDNRTIKHHSSIACSNSAFFSVSTAWSQTRVAWTQMHRGHTDRQLLFWRYSLEIYDYRVYIQYISFYVLHNVMIYTQIIIHWTTLCWSHISLGAAYNNGCRRHGGRNIRFYLKQTQLATYFLSETPAETYFFFFYFRTELFPLCPFGISRL